MAHVENTSALSTVETNGSPLTVEPFSDDALATPELQLSSSATEGSSTEQSSSHPTISVNRSPGIKKVPIWRIALLSTSGAAIDLVFAIEDTYAVPLIVATGLDIRYATVMLALSPIIGILFQAYLGALSDRCKCSWGRRRPFILLLSLIACLGLIIAPLAANFFNYKGLSTFGAVIGVVFFDFGMGQLQLPSRAYLLDALGPTSQVQTGNFVYVVAIGIGTCAGYVLSGIDWLSLFNKEQGEDSVIKQSQYVFSIAAGLLLLCLVATLLSVKERVSDSVSCIQACPCAQNPKRIILDFLQVSIESVKFAWHMSKHMLLLSFIMLFGFSSLFTFLFFFTSFMGGAVYGGDSSAPKDSEAYQLYAEGVRKGSWALATGAGFLAIASLLMDRIAKIIGLRVLFLSVQYVTVIMYFVLTMFPNIVFSYIGACVVLLCQGLYLTIPFILISLYEVSEAGVKSEYLKYFV